MVAAPEEPLGAAADRLANFAARRAAGEPLSRIVGKREFWGLALTISPEVLDPRPETETIVEAAVALFRRPAQGRAAASSISASARARCSARCLTEFVNARGLGVDVSACRGEGRARQHRSLRPCASGPKFASATGPANLDGPFDLIVSNPPYVRSGDIAGLPREVRDFDPRLALDGGSDGLDAYRAIMPASAPLLAAGGAAPGRNRRRAGGRRACDRDRARALSTCDVHRDLAGVERVLAARSPRDGFRASGSRGGRSS